MFAGKMRIIAAQNHCTIIFQLSNVTNCHPLELKCTVRVYVSVVCVPVVCVSVCACARPILAETGIHGSWGTFLSF